MTQAARPLANRQPRIGRHMGGVSVQSSDPETAQCAILF